MPDGPPDFRTLRRAAVALWPDRALGRFRVHTAGWANLILESDAGIMFRFPRSRFAARTVAFEARLLEYLSTRLPVPVPRPLRMGRLPRRGGWPFFCYERLPGSDLSSVGLHGRRDAVSVRNQLRLLLVALARLPVPALRRYGCAPGDPRAWANRYRRLLARYEQLGGSALPRAMDDRIRSDFETSIDLVAHSRFRPVLTHRDLGAWNILWDPDMRRVSGILDWEDAALGDPAFDLCGLSFLPTDLLSPLLADRRSPADTMFARRLAFYERCIPLQEWLFARQTRNARLLHQKAPEVRRTWAS